MLRFLLLVILFRNARSFAIQNICNQYVDDISLKVISSVDRNSKLIQARGGEVSSLIGRLIENATSIRNNIVDTFTCDGRVYGYYADQDNDCQIFHICLPMQQLFPDMYCQEDIFHFSFICPQYTIFNQEAMVCDWTNNAFPCSEADQLYARNNLMFVVPEEDVQRESSVTTSTSPAPSRPSLCCSNRKTTTESYVNRFQSRWRTDTIITATQSSSSISSEAVVDQEPRDVSQTVLPGGKNGGNSNEPATAVKLETDSRARFDFSDSFEKDSPPSVQKDLISGQHPVTRAPEPSHTMIPVPKLNKQVAEDSFESQKIAIPDAKEPLASFSSIDTIFTPLQSVVEIDEPKTTLPSIIEVTQNSQTSPIAEESHTSLLSNLKDKDVGTNSANNFKDAEESQTTFPSVTKEYEESQTLLSFEESHRIFPRISSTAVYEDEGLTEAYQPTFTGYEESFSSHTTSESISTPDKVTTEESPVTEIFWNYPRSQNQSLSKSLIMSSESQKNDTATEKNTSNSHKDSQSFRLPPEQRPTRQEQNAGHAQPPVTIYYERDGHFYGFNGWLRRQGGRLGSFRT